MSTEFALQRKPAEVGTLGGPLQNGLGEIGALGGSSQIGPAEVGTLGGPLQNGLGEVGPLTGQDTGPSRLGGLGRLAKTGGTLLTLGTVGIFAAASLPLLTGPKLWGFGSGGSGTEEPDKDGEVALTLGQAVVGGVKDAAGKFNEIRTAEFPGGTRDKVDEASGSIFFGRGSVWRPRS